MKGPSTGGRARDKQSQQEVENHGLAAAEGLTSPRHEGVRGAVATGA